MASSGSGLPVSVMTSLSLHAAVLGMWIYTAQQASKHRLTVLNGVDLMIQVRKPVAFPKPVSQPKPAQSTFDFLKMALPAVPRIAPQSLNVPLPKPRAAMQVEAPKLKDRGRLEAGPKLDMDLDKGKTLDIAKVEARIPSRKLAALAAMPRLEEVGRRRVANLPAAIAMEEKRQEALALRADDALSRATRRQSMASVQTLQEAAPPGGAPSKFSQKIASMLPEDRLEMKQAVMQAPVVKQGVVPAIRERKNAAALQGGESKKGVDIEGPLADRKVMAYEIPEFPAWAKEQGVLEANVAIRFWVNKDGEVLPNMRVEHTSGYGRLDRLSMVSLAKWKFAPLMTDEKQWGVITFRFLLE